MEEFVNSVSSQIKNSNIYFNNDFGHSIEFYDGIMFEIFENGYPQRFLEYFELRIDVFKCKVTA